MSVPAPAFLSALGLVNPLGRGKEAVARGLFRGETGGLALEDGWIPGRPARVGAVPGPLPAPPPELAGFDSRCARLLLAALEEIRDAVAEERERHGPERVGVVLGTSTSGVAEMEAAVAHQRAHGALPAGFSYQGQEMGAPARFLARCLGLRGPAYTVSTACTSKRLSSARRTSSRSDGETVLAYGLTISSIRRRGALGTIRNGRGRSPRSRSRPRSSVEVLTSMPTPACAGRYRSSGSPCESGVSDGGRGCYTPRQHSWTHPEG